jgi:uncharacterized protein with HEPN domain
MPKRSASVLVQDMLEATSNAIEFTKGMDWETFSSNKLVIAAVLRQLEVLGEVSRLIDEDTKAKAPELPWHQMAGLRNRIIHEYFDVSISMVWQIIQSDLPAILPNLQNLKTHLSCS